MIKKLLKLFKKDYYSAMGHCTNCNHWRGQIVKIPKGEYSYTLSPALCKHCGCVSVHF